ncbi:hypothetical protein MASR2M39_10070 [Ignavibacteriales bacterium]
MSEELQAKYLKNGKITGQRFGEFEYFQIGTSTFNQLKKANIVQELFDKKFSSHKPDRLIVDRRGEKPLVLAVIEDKKTGEFNTESDKIKAIQQCNNYCQEINASLGIITDGSITIWINPEEKNELNQYTDDVIKKKRSYSIIKKEDGSVISRKFFIKEKHDLSDPEKMCDETRKIYKLVIEIIKKINIKNSVIKEPDIIDPLPLARRVWQDIWVATGKSPSKCLYNAVELFIFKFLSDLEILSNPNDFNTLYDLVEKGKNANEIFKLLC